MRKTLVGLLMLTLTSLGMAEDFSIKASDMRGDMGLMEDFGPTGAVFLPDGKVLVCDRAYTVFHIFDTDGRRFRFLDYPRKLGEANFNGMCWWKDNRYFVTGSHYHIKNNPRFVENRSVMKQIILQSEALDSESGKDEYQPDTALRSSGYYGQSCPTPGEITGLAMDPKHNRIFISFDKCKAKDGTVVLFEGQLDKFLARSEHFDLKFIKTDLKPATDATTGTSYDLTDIAYVPDKGLVLLLSAVDSGGKQFGSNQLWFLKAGFGPAKLVQKDLAPGNRGSGLAIRPTEKGEYEAAIVCDNAMDESKIPSRLLYMRGLRLPMR